MSDIKTERPQLKLSLKKETLRPLSENDLQMLDAVLGGTGGGGGCQQTNCQRTNVSFEEA
jgi:hypothetical protein